MNQKDITYQFEYEDFKFKIINREISWLTFNDRVLQEAQNSTVPLLERIRFLAIFSSNLDEFYKVRVASQKRLMDFKKHAINEMNFNPKLILEAIQSKTIKQSKLFDDIFFRQIVPQLQKENIYWLDEKQLSEAQGQEIKQIFETEIEPFLTPIMLSHTIEFPMLEDSAIYLAIQMYNEKEIDKKEFALLKLPRPVLSRFWILKPEKEKQFIILLDDVIRFMFKDLFSIFDFDKYEAFTIKITRDAEFTLDLDIPEPLVKKMNKALKKRSKGEPVRFIYDSAIPKNLLKYFVKSMGLKKINLIPGGRYHNFSDFMEFPDLGKKQLKYEKLPAHSHPFLESKNRIFELISERDILLHHPYQSFDYVVRFFREAAIDPKVKSIKTTLYRLSKASNIVNSLITARMNGKVVTVVIELRARFDEQANIKWSERLEEAGVKVIYGIPKKKVHCKTTLVTRIEKGKEKYYAHLSTGNYNEKTAKLYCDDGFLTSDPRLTLDVKTVFEALENKNQKLKYEHLLVAPFYMREGFIELINQEIRNAKAGKKAYIILKMNSLVDNQMIAKLYEASNAGVKIKLIVRGICCLIPQVKNMSENIEVISIVDRFLEHSRIYIFGNQGNEIVYLSSADWMYRNLSNRVETAFPIYNEALKQQILDIIEIQLSDNTKARNMKNPLENNFVSSKKSEKKIRAQYAIYEYF